MKTWITQLRKGLIELLLLNVIGCGETYGYEIVQRLRSVRGIEVSESTVYPVLERLHKDGYVAVRREPSPSGPMRRYYSLTVTGECRISAMNRYWDLLCGSICELRGMSKGDPNDGQ